MRVDLYHNIEDFGWEEHSYSILHKYLPSLAEALNQQSEYAFRMTNGFFGSVAIDTGPFRYAIHMYLMSIFGIKDDTFKYTHINKVLQQQHKVYIKKMMCDP